MVPTALKWCKVTWEHKWKREGVLDPSPGAGATLEAEQVGGPASGREADGPVGMADCGSRRPSLSHSRRHYPDAIRANFIILCT